MWSFLWGMRWIWFFVEDTSSYVCLVQPASSPFLTYCSTFYSSLFSCKIQSTGLKQYVGSVQVQVTLKMSMKFSRRSRMFSALWCNADPQIPAKQFCIYFLRLIVNVVKGIIFIWQMNTTLMCTICRAVGWCANISHLFTLFGYREKSLYHLSYGL